MLDRALTALEGRRLALPVLDTVGLARRLLSGRLARFDLATLADRFSTSVRPCHRALPDALATAELLAALAGRAQERGIDTVEGLIELSEAPVRRVRTRRHLSDAAPRGPGVYVMRDAHGQALYVGKASDLRSRTRSYFGSRRQKPSLEAALLALDRIDTAPLGSELEAALAEIELIQAWRPPANVRDARPDRAVYLRLGLADPYPALGVRGQVRPDGALYAGPLRSQAASRTRPRRRCATRSPCARAARGCRSTTARACAGCSGAARRRAAARRTTPAYADGVERLRLHLEGRGEGASAALAERGAALIAERRFEEAAAPAHAAAGARVARGDARADPARAHALGPAAGAGSRPRRRARAGRARGRARRQLGRAAARRPVGRAGARAGLARASAPARGARRAAIHPGPGCRPSGTRRRCCSRRRSRGATRASSRSRCWPARGARISCAGSGSRASASRCAPRSAPGRHRRWRELAALEPPPEASALSA